MMTLVFFLKHKHNQKGIANGLHKHVLEMARFVETRFKEATQKRHNHAKLVTKKI